MYQKLLTKEIEKKLPPLYSQEGRGLNAVAYVKFFDPCSQWTWYASEGSLVCPGHACHDCTECLKPWTAFMFFGLVIGLENECGYFTLDELEKARGRLGLPMERDTSFTPMSLAACEKRHSSVPGNAAAKTFRRVCAWCQKELGGDPNGKIISHGICEVCAAKEIAK